MAHLHWDARPELHQPVVIAAFEGWNDAGEAATSALRYLIEQWGADSFAWIDPEEFYDFTSTRPTVRMVGEHERVIDWPENRFHVSTGVDQVDVVLVRGHRAAAAVAHLQRAGARRRRPRSTPASC